MASASSAAEGLEMVNRLLTRLALTEDAQLEKVLSKLLPYAISLMATADAPTRAKLMEMLSHINKRVKLQDSIKLPLSDLVKLYKSHSGTHLVTNFSIIYIEMAFDRSAAEEKVAVVPDLLPGVANLPASHADIFLRLTAKAFEGVSYHNLDFLTTSLKGSLSSADIRMLLDFSLQVILYQCVSTPEARPPAGLSRAQMSRVAGKVPLTVPRLVSQKIGFLKLISNLELEPQLVYHIYLVASCDSNDQVSREGEELLKRRASVVDLEDAELVKRLFSIFHGTLDNDAPEDLKVSAASPILKGRIMTTLAHSIVAANSFPMTVRCIFDCVYGDGTTNRLKQVGMEFAVWVFKHASNEQLKVMGPLVLSNITKLLDAEKEVSQKPLRAFGYQAIGQLSQRSPHLFNSNVEMAKRLFEAFQLEDPSLRFTIQEALNALARSYMDSAASVKKELEDLLLENIKSTEPEARFSTVFWATKVFGPKHVPSRFLCMLAADDPKLDIRELSNDGLKILDGSEHAPFKELMLFICEKQSAILGPSAVGERALLFPTKVYSAMVSYLMRCFMSETSVTIDTEEYKAFRMLLEHGMAHDGTAELHCQCSKGLLSLASKDLEKFGLEYAARFDWLMQFLGHVDIGTRQAISQILGIVTAILSVERASVMLQSLISGFSKKRYEDVHGSVCSVGYVLAQCRIGKPAVPDDLQRRATVELFKLLKSDMYMGFAAEALGHCGLRGPIPLPLGDWSSEAAEVSEPPTFAALMAALKPLLTSKENKVVQRSALAFGHLCFGNPLPELLDLSLSSLSELRSSKVEDVLISVGEALAFIWGVVPVTVDQILYSDFTSLSHSTNFFRDETCFDVEMQNIEGDDARKSVREKIVSLLEELVYSSRKEQRCAGSVWLLSLVSYCGRHVRIQELLPKFQEAFSYLLGEQNDLTQEMASRGMSIVYELGDAATREELVKALVGTLAGTASKKRPVKLMEDTEVFEKGTIGEAPSGGNLSTYKELCNLANELGQPDLIYKFMDLANYQTSLNSKRGAAFGFAKIAKRAGDALEPYLRSLVPKLFRYQHDPNKQIQDAMGHIWRSIVAEPKKSVDQFFDDIMEDLLANAGSRLWRSREAACIALADVIQGRKFAEVEKYLLRMWTMAFRARDDIKESVRTAGKNLSLAVSSLTTRLCDSQLTSERDARATIDIVLPYLLSTGITSKVAGVQSTSINMVAKLVKNAGHTIRPQLPDLIVCMLECLSSLEDQRLNYAQMHAERLGLSAEELDSVRFSLAKESPMWETLDFCLRQVDQQVLEHLTPRLVQLVRSGVGLNTRAGVARFITLLAQQQGSDIKQYAPTLVKALVPAVCSERNSAVRRAFAAAYASVMKFAGDRILQKQFTDIAEFYKTGDADKRVASALLLKELSRQASDCMKNYHAVVLPVAFLARFDEDKSVSSDYDEVWEENTSSQSVAVQLYMAEIIPLLVDALRSSSWTQKQQSAKAMIRLFEVGGDAAQPYAEKILKDLLNELQGRIWEGKQTMLDAISAVCKGCSKVFLQSQELPPRYVVQAVVAACSRKKSSFRAAAYTCLNKLIEMFNGIDFFDLVAPAMLEEISGSGSVGEDDTSKSSAPALEKSFACLTSSMRSEAPSSISTTQAANIVRALRESLQAGQWQVKLAALQCLQELAKRCPSCVADDKEQITTLVLDCISSVKIAQVHISALECLKAIVTSTGNRISDEVRVRLQSLQEMEKSAAARSLMLEIMRQLQ